MLWLAILNRTSLGGPFVPVMYGTVGTLWIVTLLAAAADPPSKFWNRIVAGADSGRTADPRRPASLPLPSASVTMGTGWTSAVQDDSSRPGPDEDPIVPDPVIEAYKKDVDRSLVREQLRRSVDERVRNMIAALRFAERLRDAGRRESGS